MSRRGTLILFSAALITAAPNVAVAAKRQAENGLRTYRGYDPRQRRDVVHQAKHGAPSITTNVSRELIEDMQWMLHQVRKEIPSALYTGPRPSTGKVTDGNRAEMIRAVPELAFSEVVGHLAQRNAIIDPKAKDPFTARFSREVNGIMRRVLPWIQSRLARTTGREQLVHAVHATGTFITTDQLFMPDGAVEYRRRVIGSATPHIRDAIVAGTADLADRLRLVNAIIQGSIEAKRLRRLPRITPEIIALRERDDQLFSAIVASEVPPSRSSEVVDREVTKLRDADEDHMHLRTTLSWLQDTNTRRASLPGMNELFPTRQEEQHLVDHLAMMYTTLDTVRNWLRQGPGRWVPPPR